MTHRCGLRCGNPSPQEPPATLSLFIADGNGGNMLSSCRTSLTRKTSYLFSLFLSRARRFATCLRAAWARHAAWTVVADSSVRFWPGRATCGCAFRRKILLTSRLPFFCLCAPVMRRHRYAKSREIGSRFHSPEPTGGGSSSEEMVPPFCDGDCRSPSLFRRYSCKFANAPAANCCTSSERCCKSFLRALSPPCSSTA
jgi:hypothetical protein